MVIDRQSNGFLFLGLLDFDYWILEISEEIVDLLEEQTVGGVMIRSEAIAEGHYLLEENWAGGKRAAGASRSRLSRAAAVD